METQNTTPTPYDSTEDTRQHIAAVRNYLQIGVLMLQLRGQKHDASKLLEPEKAGFDAAQHLKTLVYGSEAYKASLVALKPALDHHYANNSHHPEFYAGDFEATKEGMMFTGINAERLKSGEAVSHMTLLDLVEMICDWKAAGERHADGGDIERSIQINTERFGLSPQLVGILRATAAEFGMLRKREDRAGVVDAPMIQPLTGTWLARCVNCGQEYPQHCGSTPCCGSIATVVKHDPDGKPPERRPGQRVKLRDLNTGDLFQEQDMGHVVTCRALEQPRRVVEPENKRDGWEMRAKLVDGQSGLADADGVLTFFEAVNAGGYGLKLYVA